VHYSFLQSLIVLLLLLTAGGTVKAQASKDPTSFFQTHHALLSRNAESKPLPLSMQEGEGYRKSASLAVLYSVLLPGMGEAYAGRFDRGKYPLIAEAGLWLGLIGVNTYGNWVRDDARTFAGIHAGVQGDGKPDEYFVHIENYTDVHDYNNQRLIERRLDELYPDDATWGWAWDSNENRLYYKDRRILSDKMHNAVSFFILGMVANRIWSAIQGAALVRDHNARMSSQASWLPDLETRTISRAGKVDEIRFTFSW
jgi:hypothetical protein